MTAETLPEPVVGGAVPVCTVCESVEVRVSRSSYPHDQAARLGGTGSFWRCQNCGARFLGPRAPRRRRRSRGPGRSHRDPLSDVINLGRAVKRWAFPLLAILVTIIVVIYILDQRAGPLDRITLPGR